MSKSKPHVVITGFMGTGKTAVAQAVAQMLGKHYVDTDSVIEAKLGKTISQIFGHDGENAFRKAEKELCEELANEHDFVIATGGGTLIPNHNFQMLAGRNSIFCLEADRETILDRIARTSERPLLHGKTREEQGEIIRQLLTDREPAYRRIFHHIQTDKRSLQEIAEEIVAKYQHDLQFLGRTSMMVRTPNEAPYPICIESGVLDHIGSLLTWLGLSHGNLGIVANHTLWHLHGMRLQKRLEASGFAAHHCTIAMGEEFKTPESVQKLYDQFLTFGFTRSTPIIALGGGVTGDVAGFAAATFLRGVPFIQIPTTLLAMVDASVGGKTGVDLPQGKNLVGAFKQPLAVLIDPLVLQSLPVGEFRSGMAEVVKHAIIGDKRLFYLIDQMELDDIEKIICRALRVKVDVVQKDPFEKDLRAVLNLGHTFGHAIELCSDFQMRHGDAVAIGLVGATKLGALLGKCDPQLVSTVEQILTKLRLPTRVKLNADAIFDAMRHDKKRTQEFLRFIVPEAIGRVVICDHVHETQAKEAIAWICS